MSAVSPRGAPSQEPVADRWAAASAYESFMGRWSRRLALEFVSWLQVPARLHWLDVGCGTGALTEAICKLADPVSVVGCDSAGPLIEHARERHVDQVASFVTACTGSLPTRPGGFGSITSLLALNFFPGAGSAIEEMRAIAASGATISACVWDYAGRMEFLRRFWDAAASIDPAAAELDEGKRFPVCRPDVLEGLFKRAGLREVRCAPIEIATEFSSFDDFWRPFLGGTGPAPTYVASLDDGGRTALAAALERALPRRPGGAIPLVARAWAARGTAA